jgi:Tannase and feruloyl esterase
MKHLLMLACASAALIAPGLAHGETACADMAATALPHAQITSATQKDGLCRIAVTSRPTADSEIGIEVWIPLGAAWNGKFVQMGNGGFAGTVPSAGLKAAALRGYATAGTDDGHRSTVGSNGDWALGHPEKLIDFGWRALKETTDIGNALIHAQKTGDTQRTYFFGCSDGGREALMEAQRFPADFDGIVAGAPANYMTDLFGAAAANEQALHKPGGYLGFAQLRTLQSAALADCGGEAFIRDPAACHFNPHRLLCKPGQTENCLNAAQVRSAVTIYEGRRDPRSGKIAFPGFSPGAEAEMASWQQWTTGPEQAHNDKAALYQFSSNAFKYFAFHDPNYDILTLDQGAGFDGAKTVMGPIIDSANPDLSAFKARGGKLIQFHDWNDPAIPARSSIRYYEDVSRTMGPAGDFYRLYLVLGMLHCGGGHGPGKVDWLAELDGWVEKTSVPGDIQATPATGTGPGQLLCPYPAAGRRDGKGGWRCALPKG